MKITIKGNEYQLNRFEVTYTKKMAATFIKRMREEFHEKGTLRAYLTFLIVLYVMAQDCIEQFSAEDLDLILSSDEPGKEK